MKLGQAGTSSREINVNTSEGTDMSNSDVYETEKNCQYIGTAVDLPIPMYLDRLEEPGYDRNCKY